MINRRQLLVAGAAAIPLAACNGVPTAVPTWVAAIQAIGQEAKTDIPLLQMAGVSIPSNVLSYIQDVQDVAASVGAASTEAYGQAALGAIEAYVNELAPVVVPIIGMLNPALGASLALIAAALPAVEVLLSVAVSGLSPIAHQLAQNAPAPAKSALNAPPSTAPTSTDYLRVLMARHG